MASSSATGTILVRIAPGTVWKTWLDLPKWEEWQPETLEARWLNRGKPWETGSTFMLRRRIPFSIGKKIGFSNTRRFIGQVLSVAEGQLLVWELRPTQIGWFGPILVQSVRFAPSPGGTSVSLTLTAHGLGPRLFGFALRGPLQSQVEATLEGLRYTLLPIVRGR